MKTGIDTTGARMKIRALGCTGRATEYQLTEWGARVVRAIMTSGILKTRTGRLKRNVGMLLRGGENALLTIGTGIGPTKSVKYARIHEEGGTIVPKTKKALTVPIGGVKGAAANYAGLFVIKSKATNQALLCQKTAKGGIRPLFVLMKKVTIPARQWFSRPLNAMRPELDEMLGSETLWEIAQKMG